MSIKSDLISYTDAGFPIIYINSFEETKIDKMIREVMGGREGLEWNGANGFCTFYDKKPLIREKSLADTLDILCNDEALESKFLVLKDTHLYFDDFKIIACLKDLALQITSNELDFSVIIVSPVLRIPKELEKYVTIIENEYPDQNEIKNIIKRFCGEVGATITDNLLEEMSISFKGLTEFEIDNLLALALADDGMLTRGDLQLIFTQKRQMIMKSGILEMIELKERPDDIGGLENLKEWLDRKSKVFKAMNRALEYGVDMPKGVLIAGVPGCGKSLCAKVTAQMFDVPLLRLDMGKIMGRYVGESEENMRKAIALAEAISPCVLWIDELEKAFAGVGGGGNEVTVRLFGTFLTWMQEKTSATFVVATANDISNLPPELLRKGRFDDTFYVGLPNQDERRKIFEIHIGKRRKQDLKDIDLYDLVDESGGYSGADIEGVVIEAVENAFVENAPSLNTQHILDVMENTNSVSDIMGDSLNEMEESYNERNFKSASR
ncbi:MAG TPA: hypothetical protein DCG28_01600 [Lachnospiraceae bacterium]|nr:hypothetical protein [Lachnospiraceae bacterium]